MIRIVIALLALLPAAFAPASAQTAVSVRPDQEVRIQAPQSGLHRVTIATVMSVSADTVVVQTAVRDTVRDARVLRQFAVPVAHLWRLEVEAGRRNPTGGMVRGVLIGAGVGVVGALAHKRFSARPVEGVPCDEMIPTECPFPPESRLLPYDHAKSAAIIGAGAVIGVVVGALKPGRRWQSVLPRPADAFAGPAQGGGIQVGATLPF